MPSRPEVARLRAIIWNDLHRNAKGKKKCTCGRMVGAMNGVWPAPHLTFDREPCLEPVRKLPVETGLEKMPDDEG